jgi:hypothetical protein
MELVVDRLKCKEFDKAILRKRAFSSESSVNAEDDDTASPSATSVLGGDTKRQRTTATSTTVADGATDATNSSTSPSISISGEGEDENPYDGALDIDNYDDVDVDDEANVSQQESQESPLRPSNSNEKQPLNIWSWWGS